jgi:capsular polysaccharide transport system permease protein
MRELHTRFGRENVGFLWFIIEPMMLAIGIAIIHTLAKTPLPEGLDPVPFYVSGYVPFMMFRSNAIRAASTVLSNRVLMYHRQVALVDLLLARTILELIASMIVLLLLLYGAAWAHLGPVPERPLLLIAGMVFMFWLTTAMAMVVCALVEFFPNFFDRLVPAFVYLSVPVSGMFFRIDWLPERLRQIFVWIPLPQIVDICRLGVYRHLEPNYIRVPFLFAFCGVLTLIGLFGLNAVRGRIKFS